MATENEHAELLFPEADNEQDDTDTGNLAGRRPRIAGRLALVAVVVIGAIAGVAFHRWRSQSAFRQSTDVKLASRVTAQELSMGIDSASLQLPPELMTDALTQAGAVSNGAMTGTSSTFTVTISTVTATSTTITSTTHTTTRKGSFLVIGDWGFDAVTHGTFKSNECQRLIADAMHEKMQYLGDVKFIVNVGDSFYPCGVRNKEDPQWQQKWRNIFSPELRSVPWWSVYGNHDYQKDPCACSDSPGDCAQVNYDTDNREFFAMPGLNYYQEYPELDLEVVALDLNYYMWGFNTKCKDSDADGCEPEDCHYTGCFKKCIGNLKWRANEAFKLFHERAAKSTAKNLVVFSHYPTDYLFNETGFLAALSDPSKHHIEYFGGHRHSVDQQSTWQTKPNNNWLVGGGGGWGCEGGFYMYPPRQGFVVGEIDAHGGLSTYSVLVNHTVCCPTITKPAWKPKFEF